MGDFDGGVDGAAARGEPVGYLADVVRRVCRGWHYCGEENVANGDRQAFGTTRE